MVGLAVVALGVVSLTGQLSGVSSYGALASEDGPSAGAGGAGGPDWDALIAANPDVVAWASCPGAGIDLPVVQRRDGIPSSYYLRHSFDGGYSPAGCPFLDDTCDADGAYCLAYGHHLAAGGMFSSLRLAYRQDVFDTVGELTWYTPNGGATVLRPVMSSRVRASDRSYALGGLTSRDVSSSLLSLLHGAGASSRDAEAAIRTADRAVVLVTCSEARAGMPWRTVTVFVS